MLRLCVVLALLTTAQQGAASLAVPVTLSVNDATAIQTVDELYLGFNLDSGSLYRGIDLGDPVLQRLTANLAPAQLRVGGSASDSLWYVPDGASGAGPSPDPLAPGYAALSVPGYSGYIPNVTLVNNALWTSICGFAEATGTQLLWDLNAVDFRTAQGAWDAAANATALLAFTQAQGLTVAAWELGNEPDIWAKHFLGLIVSGEQLASDLNTLKQQLSLYGLSTRLFGPSFAEYNATLTQSYLSAWSALGGGPLGFTAHAYPLGPPSWPIGNAEGFTPVANTPRCSLANFLNLESVLSLSSYLAEFSAAVAQFGEPSDTRMVLEETASNSLGGCPGYSDRFVSGFYWLNIMGLVAESSWQQLNRQDLAGLSFTSGGSQYTLFGTPGWTNGSAQLLPAHPDYFTTLLFKALMGSVVLSSFSAVGASAPSDFTAHIWCSNPSAPGAAAGGAITVAFINANGAPAYITSLSSTQSGRQLPLVPRREYILTAAAGTEPFGGLQGYGILLNGEAMSVNVDGSLPSYLSSPQGRLVGSRITRLTLPAYSYGFVSLLAAGVALCPGAAAQ
jgi:heparanase 1